MILVTGGAGFIGSHFVRHWLAQPGQAVLNLDKLTYAGQLAHIAELARRPEHVFVRGDIADADLLQSVLAHYQPSAIVHFAAESHVDRAIAAADAFVGTNIVGTWRLLDAACRYWSGLPAARRERFRFLHVSTDEVYGSLLPQDAPWREQDRYAPRNPYSASKAAGDHLAQAWFHTYGLPVLLTHSSNNYGPRQHVEKLIPRMISCALTGQPLPVYGDGRQVRDWLHVSDHCQALMRVLARGVPGRAYNIGAHCLRSNLELVQLLCQVLDDLRPREDGRAHAEGIRHVADRPGHDRRYALDASRMRRELGWQPAISLRQGLRQTVAWYVRRHAAMPAAPAPRRPLHRTQDAPVP